MESVASHEHWCDKMLACSYPLGVASKMLDNLKHQKSVLENQRNLIQQQIHYYRVSIVVDWWFLLMEMACVCVILELCEIGGYSVRSQW